MGGPVPLGYDVENKRLVVNPEEAERVRLIFRHYLELGSLTALLRDLRKRGVVTKVSPLSGGRSRGGIPFTKGPLQYLLRNRVYVGDLVHKDQHFPGEHESIVDRELFAEVQASLASKAATREHGRINNQSILVGKIFDDRGNRMTPSTTKKGGARYRYYVSSALAQGKPAETGSVRRVPAPEIETLVLQTLRQHMTERVGEGGQLSASSSDGELVSETLERVVVRQAEVEVAISGEGMTVSQAWSFPPTMRRREILAPAGQSTSGKSIRSETRARLVEGITRGRLWLRELVTGEMLETKHIAAREGCSDRFVRMTLSLAFLDPRLVKAAVEGRMSRASGSSALFDGPASWRDQFNASNVACRL